MTDQDHPEAGGTDVQMSAALGVQINTIARIPKDFVHNGMLRALERRQGSTPPVPRKLDGSSHAHLVPICCSDPPSGHVRWTLTLLVSELKRRGIVAQISTETVGQSLKKTNWDLGRNKDIGSRKKTGPAL
ncbi:MAG: helix-turn-helix domain-containing protein [Okeania sp. SIO1H6]|nr:helix-turn-helix domain-containing protein [Okeania sp. SIO1H6]